MSLSTLQVLEEIGQIERAQRALVATVRKGLRGRAVRTIGYPGGHRADETLATDGEHWFWTGPYNHAEEPTPRHLNWFGRMAGGSVSITTEINPPFEGATKRIGGYFARDPVAGVTWLMHSGRVGGGARGVGKEAFRAWHAGELLPASDSEGKLRFGYAVMPVHGDASAVRSVIRYVESIATFKERVREGLLDTRSFGKKLAEYRDYFEEASGRRTGRRRSRIDYVSRHGEVVSALRDWREDRGLDRGERIVKNVYLDLGVRSGGRIREVYEVKTDASRSNVHSGLGQLLVQSAGDGCAMILVLPEGEPLATDLRRALRRLGVDVLRYGMDTEGAIAIR